MKLAAKIALIGAAVLPFVASAQPAPSYAGGLSSFTAVTDFINTVVQGWIFWILIAFVIIFILYAAFLYLTSGGDPEKTGKAKGVVIYAVIALALALLARSIVALVSGLVQSR